MSQTLSVADYKAAANSLGTTVAVVRAVVEVESNGSGFLADGRPVVQYEPHVMYQRLRAKFGTAYAENAVKMTPSLVARSMGGYGTKVQEHDDMGKAAKLYDRDSALESASWGAFQIMGYHWKTCGYPSLQDFVNGMYRSAASQLDAFVRFVNAHPTMRRDLVNRNWAGFARRYNGPAYEKNRYDTKLAQAHDRYIKVMAG